MHKIKIKSIKIFVKCSKTYTSNSSDYLHRELATHSTLWAWTNCIHLDQILYYKRSLTTYFMFGFRSPIDRRCALAYSIAPQRAVVLLGRSTEFSTVVSIST